jgi:hypothetical protein
MSEAIFKGVSGKLYRFAVQRTGALTISGDHCGGLYIFARPERCGWQALHLGRTADLTLRLDAEDTWEEAVRMGGAFVLTLVIEDRNERIAAELDLRSALRPRLDDIKGRFGEIIRIETPEERAALRRVLG